MSKFTRSLPILLLLVFGCLENANWARAAQPPPYNRQANFTDWSTAHPDLPHPGTDLDNEDNAIKTTLDAILHNLALIQRDDGALANGSVSADQLDPAITLGVRPVGDWLTGTAYSVNDAVWENNILYRAIVSHTSGTFATDLAAGDWVVQLDLNQYVTASAASATAAALSAAGAGTSATSAGSSSTAAAGSATTAFNAAASATASQTAAASSASSAATSLAAIQAAWRGPWLTSTAYAVGDKVSDGGSSWICTSAHTSGASTEPGVGGSYTTVWNIMAQKGSAGAGSGDLISTNNLSDVTNAATARGNLGLAIGTNVQAYDAELAALAGLTSAANKVGYFTGAGTAATTDYTSAARTFDAATDAAGERTAIGAVIGTNVQAWDADLDAVAGVTTAANKIQYWSALHTAALADYTAAARTFDAATDAAGERTAIGAGTVATLASDTDGTLAANSDSNVATQKAVKTYVDAHGGSGSFVFLASHTASGSATLDFGSLPATCSEYKFVIAGIRPATNNVDLVMRTSTDGGATFSAGASNYFYHQSDIVSAGSAETYNDSTGTYFVTAATLKNIVSYGVSGEVEVYAPANTTDTKLINSKIFGSINSGGTALGVVYNYNGYRNSTGDIDGVRFLMSSGNIASGTIYAYCLKTS